MKNETLTDAVTVRLPKTTISFLKRMARSESMESDDYVNHVDLIRRAIRQTFPFNGYALMSEDEKAKAAFELAQCDSE